MKRWLGTAALAWVVIAGVPPVSGGLGALAPPDAVAGDTDAAGVEAKAAIDPKKKADIEKLLELTGAADLGKMILDQMVGSFKSGFPDVPQEFWTKFAERADLSALVGEMIPIYDGAFTHDEIKDLIRFYQTKTGKKVITAMPQVTQQAMLVGRAWGETLAAQVINEIQAQQKKDGE